MARTSLTVQEIAKTGLTPSYAAIDQVNGNLFLNDGKTFVHCKNGDASGHTLTFTTPGSVDGWAITNPTVVVPAGSEEMIGPFATHIFNNSDGVYVDIEDGTSVTIAVIRLP